MGAVSVFTVGNYLNQPSVIFLLCEMLSLSCVVSSVDFFSVELVFVVILFDVIFSSTSLYDRALKRDDFLGESGVSFVQIPADSACISVALMCWSTGELPHVSTGGVGV